MAAGVLTIIVLWRETFPFLLYEMYSRRSAILRTSRASETMGLENESRPTLHILYVRLPFFSITQSHCEILGTGLTRCWLMIGFVLDSIDGHHEWVCHSWGSLRMCLFELIYCLTGGMNACL
jgi:hypothetical protein